MAKQQGALREKSRLFTSFPKHYKVIIYNDDFTPMEFVVKVLVEVFCKPASEAQAIMLAVHHQGQMVVGLYSYDMAVSLVRRAIQLARDQGFPLRLAYEPE